MNSEETMMSPYASKLEERLVFFLVFVGALTLTYGALFLIDFLPEEPSPELTADTLTAETVEEVKEEEESVEVDPLPVEIIFDALEGRTLTVQNPDSTSVEALDAALLSGAVRHPDSADFERTGTIFLFGHSSYLPNVRNKNFQAFNGIQKLTWGDTIRLRSSDTEYVYRVDRVYKASATDAEVEIESGTPKLTLVTCDSFGTKSDRFIVEASLIESSRIGDLEVS